MRQQKKKSVAESEGQHDLGGAHRSAEDGTKLPANERVVIFPAGKQIRRLLGGGKQLSAC